MARFLESGPFGPGSSSSIFSPAESTGPSWPGLLGIRSQAEDEGEETFRPLSLGDLLNPARQTAAARSPLASLIPFRRTRSSTPAKPDRGSESEGDLQEGRQAVPEAAFRSRFQTAFPGDRQQEAVSGDGREITIFSRSSLTSGQDREGPERDLPPGAQSRTVAAETAAAEANVPDTSFFLQAGDVLDAHRLVARLGRQFAEVGDVDPDLASALGKLREHLDPQLLDLSELQDPVWQDEAHSKLQRVFRLLSEGNLDEDAVRVFEFLR